MTTHLNRELRAGRPDWQPAVSGFVCTHEACRVVETPSLPNFLCASKSTPDTHTPHILTAGHIPIGPGGGVMTGKVGVDVTVEKAQEAARAIAINLLATLKGT